MLLFCLLTLRPDHARTAAHLVLTGRLATDVFLDEAIGNLTLGPAGDVVNAPLYRVLFLTKARLCSCIEQMLQTHFPANDFRIYATPVTHVNEAEAARVRQLREP
ncbi:hypothetical protein GCM10027048_02130 [Hymenobacter coalescens]